MDEKLINFLWFSSSFTILFIHSIYIERKLKQAKDELKKARADYYNLLIKGDYRD